MADDEDHGDNRTDDMKVDDTILKLAEQYVGYEKRAKALNKDKAAVREQAEKIGISSLAWQMGVRMVKLMDTQERADFSRGFKRVASVLDKNSASLFAEEIAARDKRKAKAAAKAAKAKESATAQERRVAADSPRSDPTKGGAGGKVNGRGKAKDAPAKKPANARSKRVKDNVVQLNAPRTAQTIADAEQEEGAAILEGHIEQMRDQTGEQAVDSGGNPPRSQSEIAAERRAAAFGSEG